MSNVTTKDGTQFSEWLSNSIQKGATAATRNDARFASKEYFLQTPSDKVPQELATLLAALGPAVSSERSTFSSKVMVLCYILGAFDAILSANKPNETSVSLPFEMMNSVSHFMLELCGPFVDSSSVFDPNQHNDVVMKDSHADSAVVSSDDVRDEAMRCVCALLETKYSSVVSISSCMQFRVKVAKKAVQKRCMSIDDCNIEEYEDDDDDDEDDDYDMKEHGAPTEEEAKILSDLSLLPRAKRALCFQVLESAATGMDGDKMMMRDETNGDMVQLTSSCCKDLVEFTVFAASCLHGETDPRCLMQMLRLLKRILHVLSPIVESGAKSNINNEDAPSASAACDFPFTTIFDAVAVYYPVRFTPPPNDPHGITREGIHNALMDVLTFTDWSAEGVGKKNGKDHADSMNMTTLAAGLFLERMSPPRAPDFYGDDDDGDDGQEPSTVRDRIEALEDLTHLIYKSQESQEDVHLALEKLKPSIIKEMSNVLYRCHEDAASNVTKSDQDSSENKVLADSCRHFVVRMAYDFEKLSHSHDAGYFSELWNIFVRDRIKDIAGVIVSSPQSLKGRMGIAYLASLAACGGEQTLRLCLDAVIPSLISIIENNLKEDDENRDEEKMSTVVYGLSALFSSCRLSMEQIQKEGINIHPHPLEFYANTVLEALCHIIEGSPQGEMGELEISAVQALESLLLSTPGSILNKSEEDNTEYVKSVIKSLSQMLMSEPSYIEGKDSKWKTACARFLGSVVGKGLQGGQVESDHNRQTLLECDSEIVSYVQNHLFPFVLESSKKVTNKTNNTGTQIQRSDWTILTYACEVDQDYAVGTIVSHLYKELVSWIQCAMNADEQIDFDAMVTTAQAISQILKTGGPEATISFHGFSQKEEDRLDVLHILTHNPKPQPENGDEMSSLLLPEMRARYRCQADNAVKISQAILPHILPVFRKHVPDVTVKHVLSRVSQVIPPLSDWDGVELCTLLPVLSIILANDTEFLYQNHFQKTLIQIVPDLLDYALNKEASVASRSAAASCSFSIISKYQEDINTCVGLNLMRSNISPHIVKNIESLSTGEVNSYQQNDLVDALNLAAMVASASSQRGGASVRTADEITRFLALLSCEGAATSPSLGVDDPLDCNSDIYKDKSVEILVSAATALGSIFHGKRSNPFAKQRLAHITVPIILSSRLIDGSELSGTDLGSLSCASYILNSVQLKAFDQDKLSKLSARLIVGLDKVMHLYVSKAKNGSMLVLLEELLSLLLTTILKLYYDYPNQILPALGTIVPSCLLVTMCAEQISSVPLNLIAIQLLSSIIKCDDDRVVHFCKAYKQKVLVNLSKCLDHPSTQVRRAAVRTINLWSVFLES